MEDLELLNSDLRRFIWGVDQDGGFSFSCVDDPCIFRDVPMKAIPFSSICQFKEDGRDLMLSFFPRMLAQIEKKVVLSFS